MKTRIGHLSVLIALVVACQPKSTNDKDTTSQSNESTLEQKVIYGADDRMDLFQIMDPAWYNIATSTVALMPASKLTANGDNYDIQSKNYGKSYSLCKGEPFAEQPTAAFCSGSLIGKDLVLTAGHCVTTEEKCKATKFVFGFAYENAGEMPTQVEKNEVYDCKKIIHSEVIGFKGSDFALVQLDRPVEDREPLTIRKEGTLNDNTDLTVIGHPAGIPTKLAAGATVRENLHEDFFVANLDTYGGNSGSAVFNSETQHVEGILVRGERDFVFADGCRISNLCPEEGCRGEDVTRVEKVLPYLPLETPQGE